MNGYMPYNQTQSYQATQYFPQPQGNVYLVNNSLTVSQCMWDEAHEQMQEWYDNISKKISKYK